MNDFDSSSKLFGQCMRCGCDLIEGGISLLRCVERTNQIGPNEMETEGFETSIGEFCETCGSGAARAVLVAHGIQSARARTDSVVPLCTKCQGRYVVETAWHVVYAINREAIVKNDIETLELIYRAPVCAACEDPAVPSHQPSAE